MHALSENLKISRLATSARVFVKFWVLIEGICEGKAKGSV